MKIETKFNIDDIVYRVSSIGVCIQYKIANVIVYKDRIEYRCIDTNNRVVNQFDEDSLFSSKNDCEKNYVLKRYNYLFKDAKTLK